jgi:hypothetical protein
MEEMGMHRNVAAACMLVGFAVSAQAVSLNPKGLGQVLIYPYYTVNKSQDTYLTVANASDVGKVVKVRFLEGYNGREVLDFNLFLSAHDVWAATISAPDSTESSGARLSWSDRSCIDFLDKNPYPFLPYAYDGTMAAQGIPADSGPQTIARTREGHVEIIALGDIVPGSSLEAAITHVQPEPPVANAGVPSAANGPAGQCPGAGALALGENQLVAPTNGLFGSAAIVNVGEGTFFPYNADAVADFTDIPLISNAGYVATLQSANSTEATNGVARAYLWNDAGKPVVVDYASGLDAVSAVFMAASLNNEYLVGAGLGANTDWIVTFPTKRFHVDQQRYGSSSLAPFQEPFQDGASKVNVAVSTYDREEGVPDLLICAPLMPCGPNPMLKYEVNAIRFENAATDDRPSAVLGSRLTLVNVKTGSLDGDLHTAFGDTGWMKIDLLPQAHPLLSGKDPAGASAVVEGLPATGFMVYNIVNSNAQPGKLANYSGLFPHRSGFACSGNASACK